MGNNKILFHAKTRDAHIKPKQLRRDGNLPANIFGLSKPSQAIYFPANAFRKLYDEVGDTGLLYVKIDDQKEQPVLVDDVAYESVGTRINHVSFKRVNLAVAVTADIPIVLVGENNIPETIVTQVKQDVEVEALPQNLPESFEIDISTLTEVGQTITLADLTFDSSKITLVLKEDVSPETETLVVLQQVAEEVEETPEDAAVEETTPETSEETATDAAQDEAASQSE